MNKLRSNNTTLKNSSVYITVYIIILCITIKSSGQKIAVKEFANVLPEAILIDNFYQISLDDYNNFFTRTSTSYFERDKCYIQNFQSENKLRGQILVQLDFAGRVQYLGISKVFMDKYKKITKPKMILVHGIENCTSGINSNWHIAHCISKKIIEFISD